MKPQRRSIFSLIALLVLLALTVGAAYLPLGGGNLLLAMTISIAKALVVLLFFMELIESQNLLRLAACVGVIWLAILLLLLLSDYATRVPGTLLGH